MEFCRHVSRSPIGRSEVFKLLGSFRTRYNVWTENYLHMRERCRLALTRKYISNNPTYQLSRVPAKGRKGGDIA